MLLFCYISSYWRKYADYIFVTLQLFALHLNANAGEDQYAIHMTVPTRPDKVIYEEIAKTSVYAGYSGTVNLEIAGHLADVFEKAFM